MLEDVSSAFFKVHQLEKAKLPTLIIEKQVNIGTFTGIIPHGRAEQIQVQNPELAKLGLMFL